MVFKVALVTADKNQFLTKIHTLYSNHQPGLKAGAKSWPVLLFDFLYSIT
jgi:hypothetical protein